MLHQELEKVRSEALKMLQERFSTVLPAGRNARVHAPDLVKLEDYDSLVQLDGNLYIGRFGRTTDVRIDKLSTDQLVQLVGDQQPHVEPTEPKNEEDGQIGQATE